MKRLYKQLGRRKVLSEVIQKTSELRKNLTTLDLTALGVGCTLGVGVYVLPGVVAKTTAGPSVIISFFIAAITSVLAGLCFAEFGAKVPKAGSAYIYSYVTIGEFVAFTIGWNVIMEYIIGTASVAKGLSLYLDSMTGNKMASFYKEIYYYENAEFVSEYFDLFAFFISLLVTVGLAFGVKESLVINNLLTLVNVSVVIFVIIVGSFEVDFKNWSLLPNEIPQTAGSGGFFPFGVMGAIRGAATCFYGYVGFDVISTSGEEVKDPQKSIPRAILYSLFIVFLAYFGISSILTLMWPYYLQNEDSPIPYVFNQVGYPWGAWIVAIGGIFGLMASLFSGMFPLPRILYAMAQDGLLFKFLGKVHQKYKTPFIGTITAGIITGLMGAAFQLRQLVDLMSIATLLAYTIVAGSVILLRYRDEEKNPTNISHEYIEHTHLISKKVRITFSSFMSQLFNCKAIQSPTSVTSMVASINTLIFSLVCIVLTLILVNYETELLEAEIAPLLICIFITLFMAILLISINMQPPSTEKVSFKVPCVPYLPGISIFMNIYLMMSMDSHTWIRYVIWLFIGYLIYFAYGIRHSSERRKNQPVGYDVIQSEIEDAADLNN